MQQWKAAPRPPPSPARRPGAGAGSSDRPERLPPVEEAKSDVRDEHIMRGASLYDLLRNAAKIRRMHRETVFDGEAASPVERRPSGCLGRFILIMVFLVLALMGGLFMLGGSLLSLFWPYW